MAHWIATMLGVPGQIADALWGRGAREVELPRLTPREAADEAQASPRANSSLALEPGVDRYRVAGKVFGVSRSARNALVIGGLLGRAEPGGEALGALRERLAAAGFRRVLVVPVSDDEVGAVAEAGFRCVQVASVATLDPRDFSLAGSAHADLRQMCNRAASRFELSVREVEPGSEEADAWLGVYDRWLSSRPMGHELKLLVGTPNIDEPLGRRYFAAFGPDGGAVAAISITPGWGGSGYGVDIMSRDPDSPPGAMDLLMSETITRLGDEGRERFSLGASPMAPVPGERLRAPLHLRVLMNTLFRSRLGHALFGFRALFHFKNKFAPSWHRVFLAGWPKMGFWSLYAGGRMWGLFGR